MVAIESLHLTLLEKKLFCMGKEKRENKMCSFKNMYLYIRISYIYVYTYMDTHEA